MNEKKMRNIINQDSLIIVGMIAIILIVGSISTYAYMTWQGRDESGGLTTTIGDIAIITFEQGINLSSESLTPVLNYQDGIYTTFSIIKKVDTTVYIKSSLSINQIDSQLQSQSLKYVLLESEDNNSYNIISTGDFSQIENQELQLLKDYELNLTTTYYKLYIYIDGKENNTNMIGKSLEVTLNVGANKEKQNDKYTVLTSSTSITNETE